MQRRRARRLRSYDRRRRSREDRARFPRAQGLCGRVRERAPYDGCFGIRRLFVLLLAASLVGCNGAESVLTPQNIAQRAPDWGKIAAHLVFKVPHLHNGGAPPRPQCALRDGRQRGGRVLRRQYRFTNVTITSGIDSTRGAAVDANGTLYVANEDNSTVTEYPEGTTSPSVTITNSGGLDSLKAWRSIRTAPSTSRT